MGEAWPKTETELAKVLVDYLADMGWEVYQEVVGARGRADIVAVRGPLERRRPDSPGNWTFAFKGSVRSTMFGTTLRLAIAASGRTIKGFAGDIGLSRHAVSEWVTGRSEPRMTSAMRAADELGHSLHGLCEGQIRSRV